MTIYLISGDNLFRNNCIAVVYLRMCQGTIVHEKTATPTYFYAEFAPDSMANCTSTPDKLLPACKLDNDDLTMMS